MPYSVRVHVCLVGGEHQFLHIVPVAAWLSAQAGVTVRLFARSERDARAADELMRGLGASWFDVVVMQRALFARVWRAVVGERGTKAAELIGMARALRACDALLVAERTSAILTLLPGRRPLTIRFTHGVGDREKGFSRKAKVFDHFIVAGAKYAERFVAEGIAPRERISISGYIKIPALRRLKGGKRPRLFDDARPVVLYNPHFDQSVSSWSLDGRTVIESILAADRYNLIVAPHKRLFSNASAAEKAHWLKFAGANCRVDLGSQASTDMTYVEAADIYLGDVSSQVYEFLTRPRPCLFLNSHGVAWEADENYRMWHLGQVVGHAACELIPALDRAIAVQSGYRPLQEREIDQALGDMSGDTAARAGEIVLRLIHQRSGEH